MSDFSQFFYNEVIVDILDNAGMMIRLLISCLCGAIIGLERSKRQKDAGVRTHMIVALGAALAMIVSKYGFFDMAAFDSFKTDPSRIAANVISGVSFLGAGVIFIKDVSIKGLTTAAGIWTTAGVGMAIGAGMYTVGLCATAIMIVFQILLHRYFSRLENTVNELTVIVNNSPDAVKNFRDSLSKRNIHLERCKMTRNPDSTITLDITIKKARTISMDEIMFIVEQNDEIVSVEI